MTTGQVESEDYHEEVVPALNCCWAAVLFTQSPVLQENSGDVSKVNPQIVSVVYSSSCKKKHDEVYNGLKLRTGKVDQIVNEKVTAFLFSSPIVNFIYCFYRNVYC